MSKSPTKIKVKAPAQVAAPQTRDACAEQIRRIGDLQRELTRAEAAMNDAIAQITQAAQPGIEQLKEQLKLLQQGVQTYCEAHRDELTDGGRTKTANLITGEVNWRARPPKCLLRGGEENVVEALQALGLTRYLRQRAEVNREAVLADPEGVKHVAGISIQTGVEDFSIVPFEQVAA